MEYRLWLSDNYLPDEIEVNYGHEIIKYDITDFYIIKNEKKNVSTNIIQVRLWLKEIYSIKILVIYGKVTKVFIRKDFNKISRKSNKVIQWYYESDEEFDIPYYYNLNTDYENETEYYYQHKTSPSPFNAPNYSHGDKILHIKDIINLGKINYKRFNVLILDNLNFENFKGNPDNEKCKLLISPNTKYLRQIIFKNCKNINTFIVSLFKNLKYFYSLSYIDISETDIKEESLKNITSPEHLIRGVEKYSKNLTHIKVGELQIKLPKDMKINYDTYKSNFLGNRKEIRIEYTYPSGYNYHNFARFDIAFIN